MKKSLVWISLIFFGLILVIATSSVFYDSMERNESQKIDSFKECVEAGNPVMESYPRQCRANGETFVEEHCQTKNGRILTLADAKEIAKNSECGGQFEEANTCNENTGTYWIDLNITKEGCNPACVVNITSREARINWRCTGFIPD